MGKMTQELIEDLYIRGRAVYKKEISLKCATEEILNMYPDNIHESSAQFYLSLYSDLIKGKGSTWNQNSDLLVYFVRHIVEENPSYDELKEWVSKSGLPLKKFFNTSGLLYKEMKLKDKLPTMSEDEQLQLLATNGMLVKRPLVIGDEAILVGFKENEWSEKLG